MSYNAKYNFWWENISHLYCSNKIDIPRLNALHGVCVCLGLTSGRRRGICKTTSVLYSLLYGRALVFPCSLFWAFVFIVLQILCLLHEIKAVCLSSCQLRGHRKFPFRLRSLPFLRHLENFWNVVKRFCNKKKDVHNSVSNPVLSNANFSSLPLHYHANPPQFRKIEVYIIINCLS